MIEQPEADKVKEPPRLLRREDASRYLKDKWGITRKPDALAKLAKYHRGPRFRGFCGVPLYRTPDLDRWALLILSPPKAPSSDREAK
jgi:hypothetical protein